MLSEKTYILCILEILQAESDAEHILSIQEIVRKIQARYDLQIDRRTVYRNIGHLIDFGYDIAVYGENHKGYYLREREFEPSELRLLADAVLTAEFVPESEGRTLIKKLQRLGSVHQTKPLNRLSGVKVDRKAPNKEVFWNIEVLDEAIRHKRQASFDYVTYDVDLVQKPRRSERYVVNPYSLYLSNGQYYLISNMPPHDGLCHFRLDRIKKITLEETASAPLPGNLDLYEYARNALYMYGGATETFTLQCDRGIINDVVDRFGDKIAITATDDATFTVVVKATSQGMLRWAVNYLAHCKVLAPQWLVDEVKATIREGMEKYGIIY